VVGSDLQIFALVEIVDDVEEREEDFVQDDVPAAGGRNKVEA